MHGGRAGWVFGWMEEVHALWLLSLMTWWQYHPNVTSVPFYHVPLQVSRQLRLHSTSITRKMFRWTRGRKCNVTAQLDGSDLASMSTQCYPCPVLSGATLSILSVWNKFHRYQKANWVAGKMFGWSREEVHELWLLSLVTLTWLIITSVPFMICHFKYLVSLVSIPQVSQGRRLGGLKGGSALWLLSLMALTWRQCQLRLAKSVAPEWEPLHFFLICKTLFCWVWQLQHVLILHRHWIPLLCEQSRIMPCSTLECTGFGDTMTIQQWH